MRKINLLILILIFTTVSFAQTEETNFQREVIIAIIYSDAFGDESSGISDYFEAKGKLESEFEAQNEALKLSEKNKDKMAKELLRLSKMFELPHNITTDDIKRKISDYKLADYEIIIEKEKVKNLYDSRKSEIFGEVNSKISKALKKFANQKGYEVILDVSKSNEFTVLSRDYPDVTIEFIEFYNNLK